MTHRLTYGTVLIEAREYLKRVAEDEGCDAVDEENIEEAKKLLTDL